MAAAANTTELSITGVFVARRDQVRVRVGLCVIVALMFQNFTGTFAAVTWAGSYIVLQAIEYFLFRHVTAAQPFTRRGMVGFLAFLVLTNFWFAAFGLVEAYQAGSYGLLCAGLLWSGAILNAAMVSGQSRLALACAMTPPLLHFFSMPYFVITEGGTLSAGFILLTAGLLNGGGAITIWSGGQKLMATAASAREIARAALLDPDTGLPNRQAVQSRVMELHETAGDGVVFVAAIGIDRFVHLRGAIGHALILELICELAARSHEAVTDAPVSRLSDSTLGLAFIAHDPAEGLRIAAALQKTLNTPIPLRDNSVDVSVTVGLSKLADESAVASAAEVSIVDRAMIAVDQARATRRPVARFDATLYGSPGSNLSLMSEMLRAFENGQMSVHYQAKLALRSGKIIGIEALIRWAHPERGAIGPDLFVHMAEETGHIAALTEWVLRHAVEDQRVLSAAGHDLGVSINWSGVVIDDRPLTDLALQIAAKACGKVCFEVTETAIIGNARLARQTLERFRGAGIAISIDDYGAGLSSLAYLKNIPADELKIDRAFVMNMATDPVDAVLVRSAVALAQSLGLQCVAEGVENGGTLEFLRAMGCDMAQGFFIARPMPLAALMDFLGRSERKAG
jgi:EAL domain-containing protein (putative c-di-GMP-specific phosphodiesterase class I)/GGDEF domain-containing protein